MTDDPATAAAADEGPRRLRPARRRKPSPFPVAAGSAAAVLGLFSFLAFQLRAGNDPALGQQATAAPKRVVVKRVERRIVVTRLLPPVEQPSAAAVQATPTPAPAVTRSS